MVRKNHTAIKEFIFLGLSSNGAVQIELFVIFLFIYLIILFANSMIILATVMDRKLQTPMYFFLANLSFLDMFYSSSVTIPALRNQAATRKTIWFAECFTQMYISFGLGAVECILLAALAYDRYIAICYPLHYTIIINKASCVKIAAGTWFCGFAFTNIPLAVTWDAEFCGQNVVNHFFCEVPMLLAIGCGNVPTAELVIFALCLQLLIVPVGFIIMTYINIIRAILKIKSSAGRQKAFSTCGSHITVATMFYGSAAISYMKPHSESSPNKDKLPAIFYSMVTPMLNPLVYTLRNNEVKLALRKLLVNLR
ncbi:olfactory receptor 5AR1-like [Gastrophryne carolinensis]